jgi:hypothetical protein
LTKIKKYVINSHKAVCRLPSLKVHEVSMRKRNLFLGLVTTAALLFAAPVAASEVPDHTTVRSTRQDVEEIRGMIRASQARQGIIQAVPETAPVAPASAPAPATVTAPAPEPAPVPETAPVASAPAPVAPASAPAPAPAPESEPAPKPAPVAPATVPAPTPVPPRSVKDTAITPPACLGQEWPQNKASLAYQLNRYDHMVCLFATDEAWRRADQQDYRLGARIERGVSPLKAIGQYAPHLLPRALAILRGEEIYL